MGLLKSAATISGLTLVSRITGLLRDIVIAASFGAGPLTDAFWVAFRIPNLLRRLFAEGAFAQAFVPVLGQIRQQENAERLQQLLDRVALLLAAVLALVSLIGILAAPWVVSAMASGLRAASRQQEFSAAVVMTQVMFPYIFCMSLVAFASGVLNTFSRFAVPAFTPVLLNLSMVGTSLLLANHFSTPIYALAAGVMLGGAAQLAVQWAALARLGVMPRWRTRLRDAWHDSTVRHIIRQMGPAILGVSVAQISLLINTNIATWLAPGSVTWLSFADRLMEFPTALLGVALGTVLLPKLSAAHAANRHDDYSRLIDWGLRLMLLLGLPAALGLAMLSDGLVATLFHYGQFSATDVQQTRVAVAAYSVGLLGLLAVKILAPGFYGRQNLRTPVKVAVAVLIITQALNALLVPWLAHAGLALSIGLGATINAVVLAVLLRRHGIYRPAQGWLLFVLKLLPALAALASVLALANHHLNWIQLGATPAWRALWLGATVAAGALAYFALLTVTGFRLKHFTRGGQ